MAGGLVYISNDDGKCTNIGKIAGGWSMNFDIIGLLWYASCIIPDFDKKLSEIISIVREGIKFPQHRDCDNKKCLWCTDKNKYCISEMPYRLLSLEDICVIITKLIKAGHTLYAEDLGSEPITVEELVELIMRHSGHMDALKHHEGSNNPYGYSKNINESNQVLEYELLSKSGKVVARLSRSTDFD